MTSIHIGILGSSYPATAYCFSEIGKRSNTRFGACCNPKITLHIDTFLRYIQSTPENWNTLIENGIQALLQAKVDLVLCPANTVQDQFREVATRLKCPIIDLQELIVSHLSTLEVTAVGLIGTSTAISSKTYSGAVSKIGAKLVLCDYNQQLQIDSIIKNELVLDCFTSQSNSFIHQVKDSLLKQGAQVVVLACTELPLLVPELLNDMTCLDSCNLLIEAALTSHSRIV